VVVPNWCQCKGRKKKREKEKNDRFKEKSQYIQKRNIGYVGAGARGGDGGAKDRAFWEEAVREEFLKNYIGVSRGGIDETIKGILHVLGIEKT